jgi:CRP/FNR family transcriptional regulator
VVKISKKSFGSKTNVVLRFAGAGDFLGCGSLEANSSFSYTAAAIEDSEVCFIPMASLAKMHELDGLSKGLLAVLRRDLEQNEKTLCNLSQRSLREKFAFVLLDLADRFGVKKENGTLIRCRLSRTDLAALCGTVIESAARVLGEFQEEKLIRLERREILIMSPAKLKAISGK